MTKRQQQLSKTGISTCPCLFSSRIQLGSQHWQTRPCTPRQEPGSIRTSSRFRQCLARLPHFHPQSELCVPVRRFLQSVSGHAVAVSYSNIVAVTYGNDIALILGNIIVFP